MAHLRGVRTGRPAAIVLAAVLAACGQPHGDAVRPSPVVGSPAGVSASGGHGAGPGASQAGARTLTVVAAGDVLVHPQVWQQAQADAHAAGRAGFDFYPMFAGVARVISAADLAICHLEVPLAPPGGPYAGYPSFSAPPQVLDGIERAGFDACSTASNHTLDSGEAGVRRTIEALDRAGLGHTGSARSAVEAATPVSYDVGGVRVGHLAYSLHFNGQRRPAGKEWLANLIEPEKIRSAARRLRATGAEIVVLSLHWGTEYRHAPDADQRRWAEQLIASPDIDLILGHHAHVVQPFERFGDKWVVYGMGNELARHAEPINDNREGVMARITFRETGPGRWRISRVEAIPTWVELTPRIRLVDLPGALADPATTGGTRRTYQAAYDRIAGYVRARGGTGAGLVVVAPGG